MQRGFAGAGVIVAVLVVALMAVISFVVAQKYSARPLSSGAGNSQTAPATLSGVVTQGPTRPVCNDAAPCTSPVASHTIEAVDADGKVAATTKTDSAGKYSLHLEPGHYTLKLVPRAGLSALSNSEVDVTGGSQELNLTVDSGIR